MHEAPAEAHFAARLLRGCRWPDGLLAPAGGMHASYAGDAEVYMTPAQRDAMTEKPIPKKAPEPFKTRSIFHVVATGETFYSISKKYDESVEQIKAYNKMGEDAVLKAGQRIVVKRVE